MLNIEEHEDSTDITTSTVFPEDKVSKEAVEVVPVTKQDLQEHQKKQLADKKAIETGDKKVLKEERSFIKKKNTTTKKDLDKREIELEDLIKRKQERSKKEFEMKKEVLKDSFR